MKKVLVINTGGTIGMQATAHGYAPAIGYLTQTLPLLLKPYAQDLPTITILEYSPLMDSANMAPTDWVKIANDIAKHYDHYDGFLVLHGTDTLAYTASALSFMLEHLAKPVICTGSQLPLGHVRTDAMQNIIDSLLYIQHYAIPEVCIYFDRELLRGNRSRKTDANRIHAFTSPNYPILGQSGVELSLYDHNLLSVPTTPMQLRLIRHPLIAHLNLFPGLSANILDALLTQPLDGLIIASYGTGNGPAQNQAFLTALRRASDRGLVIINVTQCWHGSVDMNGYATGQALAECGVLSGYDMTPEAALTKLYYLLSADLTLAQVKQQASKAIRGELTQHSC